MSANFRGKGVVHRRLLASENYRGVVYVILRLAVLIQYRRVTHRHTMMANTRASLARVKLHCKGCGSPIHPMAEVPCDAMIVHLN